MKRTHAHLAATFSVVLALLVPLTRAATPTSEQPDPAEARIAWWRDARFGMFIHWGPVALKGTEIGWSRGDAVPIEEYDALYQRFNPTQFDADAWAATAKAAGMKYVVLTTKHHDGFCLWDTKQTDYNIMHSPFGRDVVKELSEACRRAGLRFGTYYSTCDWHHPDFPLTSPGGRVRRPVSDIDRYEQYLKAQVAELITNYGPLGVLWFDVPQEFDATRGQRVIDHVRSLQPDIIVNNRTGAPGDFDTPEQRVGGYRDDRPWESCITICRQWAWKPDDDMKSLKECLHALVLSAGGDGNLLFNVGPTPEGVIEPRQVDRLKQMGAWLAKNGASVYGTRGGPWKPTRDVASTRRGHEIFVHLLRNDTGTIELTDIGRRVKSATRLDGGQPVKFRQQDGKLTLTPGKTPASTIDLVIRLELDGSAMDLPAIALPTGIKATASNVANNDPALGPKQAFDQDPATRWTTAPGTTKAWIAADLGRPRTIQRVRIEEVTGDHITNFELQYRDGSAWKTVLSGSKVGYWFDEKIPPVTAREFRLVILDAKSAPVIAEIEFVEL